MRYATAASGERIEATPGADGTCPVCQTRCIPKCGWIVTWHWAHATRDDCDLWAEPDSKWHRDWQSVVPAEQREFVIGPHRADIITARGTIVELQHSAISPSDIAERERFYGRRLVWLFDASDAYATGRLDIRRRRGQEFVTFRWKHPRKSIACCTRTVLLDLNGTSILHVRRMHPAAPCGGWGHLGTRNAIKDWLRGESP